MEGAKILETMSSGATDKLRVNAWRVECSEKGEMVLRKVSLV